MYGKTDRTRYPVNMPSRNCRKVAGSDTRTAAFAIGIDMLVAAILVHVHFGFFMNWLGKEKGEGIEFDLPGLGRRVSPHLTGWRSVLT